MPPVGFEPTISAGERPQADCNETTVFSIGSRQILKTSNFIKIRPVGAELFHADRRTDERTGKIQLIVAFAILRTRLKMS